MDLAGKGKSLWLYIGIEPTTLAFIDRQDSQILNFVLYHNSHNMAGRCNLQLRLFVFNFPPTFSRHCVLSGSTQYRTLSYCQNKKIKIVHSPEWDFNLQSLHLQSNAVQIKGIHLISGLFLYLQYVKIKYTTNFLYLLNRLFEQIYCGRTYKPFLKFHAMQKVKHINIDKRLSTLFNLKSMVCKLRVESKSVNHHMWTNAR